MQQQGPGSSYLFMWPGFKSWDVVMVDVSAFYAVAELVRRSRIAIFRSQASWTGVGGIGVRRTDPVVVQMYIL